MSALSTDRSAYVATCTDDGLLTCTFRVEATYRNRTDAPVYLRRCYPDSEAPAYGVLSLNLNEESAYSPNYGCVGHDDQIEVTPGGTRVDVLEVKGPNSVGGGTHAPLGVLGGAFRLAYAAHPCANEGACERLPEAQQRSIPFKVTIHGLG